jgi:hypothetical protein
MRSLILCSLLLLSTTYYAAAQEATDLPNPTLTPGAVRTTDVAVVCDKAHKTSEIRNVPGSVKNAVYRAYGLANKRAGQCSGAEGCEVDHLISLELGGSNEPANLWAEPYDSVWNAHVKDRLENELHKRVCAGRLNLTAAQTMISVNWVKTYQDIFGPEPVEAKR